MKNQALIYKKIQINLNNEQHQILTIKNISYNKILYCFNLRITKKYRAVYAWISATSDRTLIFIDIN